MKTNKTKKRKSGFTLVELIVVIAILAILAGVAIPVYSSYITKANEAADYTTLDAVKTAVVFVATEKNLPYAFSVKSITVGTNAKQVTVEYNETAPEGVTQVTTLDISAYLGNETITYKSGATGATWYAEATTGENAHAQGWTLTKPTAPATGE